MSGLFFCYHFCRGENMNIAKFIQDHKELNELPFLIVFKTICVLKEMNMLKTAEDKSDVEKAQ